MCGIIGILSDKAVAMPLLEGLKRLEYRGYDSAGIATLHDGKIVKRRKAGKLINLEQHLIEQPLQGTLGIGHTRWATHGAPTENNAHPHSTDKVAVVHNGIIENFQSIKNELDHSFYSETDTEIIAALITLHLKEGLAPAQAVFETLQRLEGAFAFAAIFVGHHDVMIAARKGCPLAVGFGEGETYIGSDALALAPFTNRLSYLEDGDWVEISDHKVTIRNLKNEIVTRPVQQTSLPNILTGKGGYRHFMLKEIYEQPSVVGNNINSLIQPSTNEILLPPLPFEPAQIPRITILACGTSYYAGMVAKYWLERIAHIPVELDLASEFRYRQGPMPKGGVALFISQSGETADTLAALRYAKIKGQHIVSLVNVPESSMDRDSDLTILTHAGPEIGVASTKAFTTQLISLACLTIGLARRNGAISVAEEASCAALLREIPARMSDILAQDANILDIAHHIAEARDVLYIGRGTAYPIALEGALKLKEISYIHAEAYAAGELKHGPIALIDDSMPVIVLAPSDDLFEKTASNLQEAAARGAKILLISDQKGTEALAKYSQWTITLPETSAFTAPLLYTLPVQLLAYHVATIKGTDADQPRNLAKSVTVE